MWVVKLGGSLLTADELKLWLSYIHQKGDGKVIIVPGGSVFANAVRHADQAVKLSSSCAHQLAIMAMDQYALLLKDLEPELVICRDELEIAGRSWQHRGLIWLPSKMLLADASIPHDWSITSDTLAAWLAKKLGAEHLVLVKSIRTTLPLDKLIEADVIDSAFANAVKDASFKSWVMHKSDINHFETAFDDQFLDKIGHQLA